MIKVLIADDQALVRGGFRMLVDSEPDMTVVGEASDGAAAADLARSTRPDVILMDVQMPGTDGIEGVRRVVADPGLAGVRVLGGPGPPPRPGPAGVNRAALWKKPDFLGSG